MFFRFLLFLFLATLMACGESQSTDPTAKAARPNVLFIAVDDLRPELGTYGSPIAKTPNIDALAAAGLQFNRAYCQQAICSPSRASLMTGARPETIGVFENYTYFRDENPDIVTLPQHFRNNGYETAYAGKIYHGKFTDQEKSWSRKLAQIDIPREQLPGGYATKENQQIYKDNQAAIRKKYGTVGHYALGRGPAWERADVPDHTYQDGYHTLEAIATMKEMAAAKKPFFLGLGFKLPHLDWTAPEKYWAMYNRRDIPLSSGAEGPDGGAAMGRHASFELRTRAGIPKSGPINDSLALTLKHAYLASVSYVDAQIGKMIAALEEAGERENTIIILWSDHGWHLGDMGIWGKATNYEIATRVPMIIWTPQMPAQSRGATTDALVELVDMYPTLSELAGLKLPAHLEGTSFAPLLRQPSLPWKQAAFSQYPNPALREWAANPLTPGMRETYFGPLIEEVEGRIKKQQGKAWNRDFFENDLMGYAMRTDKYRLVVWKSRTRPEMKPVFVELYDLEENPRESRNIAAEQPELTAKLMEQFRRGWQGNGPKVSK